MTEIAKSGYKRFGCKLTRTQRLILREVTRTAKQTSLNTLFTVHYSTRRWRKEETNRKELVNISARGLGERILPGIILFTIFVYTINEIIFPPFFFKLEDWPGTKTCFLRSHKILRWIWLITSNENLVIVDWEVITIKLNICVYSWLPMWIICFREM